MKGMPIAHASRMVGNIGTPCAAARSRLMSFAGTWSLYGAATRARGRTGVQCGSLPSSRRVSMLSASERVRYSVTIAATVFCAAVVCLPLLAGRLHYA